MKAIILFAALALFAQASQLNITAYHLGFTEQLGLDPSQLQDASACFTTSQRVAEQFQDLVVAVKNEQAERAILAISELVVEVETKLEGECGAYRADLITLLAQNLNGADVKTVAERNFYAYPTQVIQQAFFWIQQFLSGDEYQAGKTEAYILQILFGLEKPEVLPMPDYNNLTYVPIDMNRFMTEYYQGYLTTLGFTNQSQIDAITKCSAAYVNATTAYAFLPYRNISDDTLSKIQAGSEIVGLIAEAVDACVDAWRVEKPILKEAWNVFTFLPVLNTIQGVLNVGQNLPEMVQRMANIGFDQLEGRYYEAGVLQGENVQTELQQIMNITYIIQNN